MTTRCSWKPKTVTNTISVAKVKNVATGVTTFEKEIFPLSSFRTLAQENFCCVFKENFKESIQQIRHVCLQVRI